MAAKFVQIVGKWGWGSVPNPVHQACLLWGMRAWKRQQTVLGVSATTALGQQTVKVPPPDPDVILMLDPYKLVFGDV